MATVNLSDYKPLKIDDAGSFRIGIVVSEWNDFVTHNLRDGALEVLKTEGVIDDNIKVFSVGTLPPPPHWSHHYCGQGQHWG